MHQSISQVIDQVYYLGRITLVATQMLTQTFSTDFHAAEEKSLWSLYIKWKKWKVVFNCPFEPEITANYEADSSAHFTLERHSAGSPGTWGSARKVKTCNFVQKYGKQLV